MSESNTFQYKTMHGEVASIDMKELPPVLLLSVAFFRDIILSGNPEKCIKYNIHKHEEGAEQPKAMPPNFKWQTDSELSAYRMMFTCLLNDIESEVSARREYNLLINSEIAGLTGPSGENLDKDDDHEK